MIGWGPSWENMAAMPWSYHDHRETWSWSCHDDGMASKILGMIMIWLPCFPLSHDSYHDHGMIIVFHVFFGRKMDFFPKFFSNSWYHIPLYCVIIITMFTMAWSWYESWERGETWQSYHAIFHDDHAMIIPWRIWITMIIPCHSMIVMLNLACQPGVFEIWFSFVICKLTQ